MYCATWYLTVILLASQLKNSAELISRQSDPYYINTTYFWSFDGLQHHQNENRKVKNILGMLDEGIRLSSYNNSTVPWVKLGPIDSSCILKPFECEDGFTILFWMKTDGGQTNAVLLNAAEEKTAKGFYLDLNIGELRFSVTGYEYDSLFPRTVQRFLDTKWNFKTWIHVGLQWDSEAKELKIFYNCSEADYVSAGVSFDRTAHVFAPPQRLIVGADNELTNSGEVEIDELGIWDGILMREEICHVFHARRVHGKYSPWSQFTSCSETCGEGLKSRTRSCTYPEPQNGGRNCSHQGPTTEITLCIDRECPIDGGYSQWSRFSECSRTCGGGQSTRIRTCTQPEPKYGGRDCSRLGAKRQIRVCNLNPCPVHGGYSTWGNFSTCTKSCENGTKFRNRTCDNPTPLHGGRNCSKHGPSFELVSCNDFPCPIHGGYSQWSNFSECSLSCGRGRKIRVRTCTAPTPQHGGKNCHRLGATNETKRCNTHFCPIDGAYSEWSDFTRCTKSCGNGSKSRNRFCDSPRPQYGGQNCSKFGPGIHITSCNAFPCPIHGGYSPWSNFSECSLSCGGGQQTRLRFCNNPTPQYGGRNCHDLGHNNETRRCNTHFCPINGGYSDWSDFTICTKTCAGGTRSRKRTCTNPKPMYGGLNCSRFGSDYDVQVCNDFPCPIDGGWGEWSHYSSCTRTCAKGRRFRTRECDNPMPKYGGKTCEDISGESFWQWEMCNTQPCPVDGGYSSWGNFSDCSKSCANGTKWRTRNCTNPKPAHGGSDCDRLGTSFEVVLCNTRPCPIHGNYTAWSEFTPCSTTCSNGTQRRHRSCTNPEPRHSGLNCSHLGQDTETRSCKLRECPIDGGYAHWTTFSECSTSCGEDGVQIRTRQCDSPAPRFGGRTCSRLGAAKQIRACNIFPCPIDGGWSEWSGYTKCSKTCESGQRVRTRKCDHPPPQYGGRNCTILSGESDVQSMECNTQRCPDIIFTLTIKIVSEEWKDSLLNFNSLEYQNLKRKILKNVKDFYNDKSPLRRIKVLKLWKGSVIADVEIHFFNILYSGVRDLQDEIFLKNRLGELDVIGINMESNDVPSVPPQNITAHNTSSRSIMVKWDDVSASKSNGNLTNFVVLHCEYDASEYTETTLDPNTYHVELKNLEIFNPYKIRVVTRNRRGEGVASLPFVVWTEMEAPTAAPQIQYAYNLSSTSMYLQWAAIPDENLLGILQGFVLNYRLNTTGANFVDIAIVAKYHEVRDEWMWMMLNTSSLDAVIRNLKKFSTYEITVAGFNRIGSGPIRQVFIRTDEDVPSEPPRNIRVVNTSSTSLKVSWEEIPSEYIHGILQGYGIFYRAENVHMWSNVTVLPDIYQLELTGLLKYQKYYIQVAGLTVKGIGKLCKQIGVMTDEDVPSVPPPGVLAVNTSSTSLLIEWDPLPQAQTHGILLGYIVYYKRRAHQNRPWILRHASATTRAIEITGLRKFTKYNIRMAGYTSKGVGKKSRLIFVPTAEDIPSHSVHFVEARALSSTSIEVKWGRIPQEQLHGILRGYKIVFRAIDINGDYMVDETIPFTQEIILENLLKFTKYGIRVIGYTSIGDGKASDEINNTTLEDLPSRPPLQIKVHSRWSSTAIPVTWQPITPPYYVHGILRGYRIKYKPVRDTLMKPINATFKWARVDPDKLDYMIKGLRPFTTYVIQVLAYTIKGNGVESAEEYGETCSCRRVFTTNWWQLTPYTTLDENNIATGIFPDVLKHAVEFCCRDCEHGDTAMIDFVGTNKSNTKSLQKGIIEVKNNLGEETDFHFPIFGTKFTTTYGNTFPYVPLVHSPGAAFLISSQNKYNESERLMKIILASWTWIVVLVLASYLVGLIMWFIERKHNSTYFPTSYLYGPWNGFWWSFITVTTVGYGDKTPTTILGRSIAILWTLMGQVLVVMFVAQITSEISSGIIGVDIKVYGKKIAVLQNSSEYRLGVKKNARYDPDVQYTNLDEIYKDLVNHKVFGALIDTYTVASAKDLFNDPKLSVNQIFDYSLNYGVVLGGEGRKLQPCLEHYIRQETEEIVHSVTKHVKPLKDVLTRNVRVDQTQSLFDASTPTYQMIVIISASFFAFLFFTGVAGPYILTLLPIDTTTLMAYARDQAFQSRQAIIRERLSSDNALTRDMRRTIQRTKGRHLKQLKSCIKQREKAEKRAERALQRERARKQRDEAKRLRKEAKRKQEESEEDMSDGNLSSTSSEGSVKKARENIWRDIEQIEGIFSLV